MVWERIRRPTYRALKQIRTASEAPSEHADRTVSSAAASAPDSWTVQREAGLYFLDRRLPEKATPHLMKAFRLFPGDKRTYLVLAATTAIDAGSFEEAVVSLQRFLVTSRPDESELDAVIVSLLALALQRQGDPVRALEVVDRLPLRREELTHPLLVGLCVRASARHSLGRRADAQRDLERVYAVDPEFPMLNETQEKMHQGA